MGAAAGSNKAQTKFHEGKNKVKTPANKVKQGKTKLNFFCPSVSRSGLRFEWK